MKRFEISLTPEAQRDASMLRYAIIFKYRAPLTAKRYLEGLNKKMKSLEVGADSIQIDAEQTERYGFEIRRINYKEMAILYSIESEKVLIQQITPNIPLTIYPFRSHFCHDPFDPFDPFVHIFAVAL